MSEETAVVDAPAAPAADAKSAAPIPAQTIFPDGTKYLTLWFDEKDDLKFEGRGFSTYMIVAVLRAATMRFEAILSGNAPKPGA